MLEHEFWLSLEYLPLAEVIGATWWFPLLNSLHVLAVTGLLGALLMLDLRLCGLAALRYSERDLMRDFLPWVWGAFVVAILSGVGLFITRASAHVLNVAFQWKMVLLLAAGLNMVYLHWQFRRRQQGLEVNRAVFVIAGSVSLVIWIAMMLAGRWMGHII